MTEREKRDDAGDGVNDHVTFCSYYLYFYSTTFLQYVLLLVTFYEHSFAKMLPTQIALLFWKFKPIRWLYQLQW